MFEKYPELLEELKNNEEYIRKSVSSRNTLLSDSVGGLITAGGKRLRPAFVILSAKFGKYNRKKVIPVAGALEVLHMATLVHDDIIDHAEYRRGRKTIAAGMGTDMAVYTGDFLFTKAVFMLSESVPSNKLSFIAKAIKSICEGEVDQYRDRYSMNVSVYSYLKRVARKTAVLFSAACALGAFTGKCSSKITRALLKFGLYYGMAFQIKDDLKDMLGDLQDEGKTSGKDIMEGVLTLPVIYSILADVSIRDAISGFYEKKVKKDEDISAIVERIKQGEGINKAQAVMKRYIQKGLNELNTLPECESKLALRELIVALS